MATAHHHLDIDRLVDLVAAPTSLPDLFNPYRDHRPDIDRPRAAAIRRRNLRRYLEAMCHQPLTAVWMAEAPGSRGAACSGVPLVPEALFGAFAARTGTELEPATTGDACTTTTADAVWNHIGRVEVIPFLWNAVMHHPHQAGRPATNRAPRHAEIAAFSTVRDVAVSGASNDAPLIAIGRVAERSLDRRASYVRHPAQGGRTMFLEQIATLSPAIDRPAETAAPVVPWARRRWGSPKPPLRG